MNFRWIVATITLLFFVACGIVNEPNQDFTNDKNLSGISFYTAVVLDSSRHWHSPLDSIDILIKNMRTISPCTLTEPNWESVGGEGFYFISWPFDGSLSVDCPLASANWDTLVTFSPEDPWNTADSLVIFGYSILKSDTLPPESLLNVTETDRQKIPLDTIYLAPGKTTLDSFYMATDSFRRVLKKVGQEEFGVVKALYSNKSESLFYSEKHYFCPQESWEPCGKIGIEYDTLDTRIPLDTTGGRIGPDTLKRLVSPFCSNGAVLCDNAFRIDSVIVAGELSNVDIKLYHTFFYERTSECNEWNLYRLRHYAWLPSAPGNRLKRSANFTLYRERFDRVNGDRDCDTNQLKNLWLSLDSLRPIYNQDTIKILDSIWSAKK